MGDAMTKRLTSAAALLGAKGGAAGRGTAKVRGDSDYYRRIGLTGLARKANRTVLAGDRLTGHARENEGPASIIPPSDEASG